MKTNKNSIRLAASLGVAALIAAPSTFAADHTVSTGYSAAALVDALIPVASGITVVGGSESYGILAWHNPDWGTKTHASNTGASAIGQFAGADNTSGLPFSDGVIISSGSIGGTTVPDGTGSLAPNNSARTSRLWLDGDGDPIAGGSDLLEDVNGLGAGSTYDAAWLSFRFQSDTTAFSFQYVFASEEYGGSEEFGDSFAFVLTDTTDNSSVNIATIPFINVPVSVGNVNGGMNAGYYTDNPVNSPGDLDDSPYRIEYDGLVGGVGGQSLYAYADIIAGRTYRIDIVIADTGDRQGDSAVFLAADSFTSEPPPNPVPEPATYVGALVLGGLIARRMRRK